MHKLENPKGKVTILLNVLMNQMFCDIVQAHYNNHVFSSFTSDMEVFGRLIEVLHEELVF